MCILKLVNTATVYAQVWITHKHMESFWKQLVVKQEEKEMLDYHVIRKCIYASTTMRYMILYQTKSSCFVSGYQHNRVACLLSSPRSALYMSELLYTYGQLDPRVCPLVFTIRHWARANQITHSGPGPWISNFTLTLLVLHHLQTTGVVPHLNTLRSLAGQ